MKKKTFIVTLLLFIVFINFSMLIVSLTTLRERMAAERERVLSEHYVILSMLLKDIRAIDSRVGDIGTYIREQPQAYAYYSKSRQSDLALSDGAEWIYYRGDKTPGDIPAVLLSVEEESAERIVYQEKGEKPKLCVYGLFPAPYSNYGLLYRVDLSDILRAWNRMKNMLFSISAVATFIAALFLAKLLDMLFKPLRNISAASRVIAEGNYHARLEEKGGDEIAVMAGQFNRMAGQIENHIKLLEETAEQKQRFVDNFAHELRTPLTAIYGYAEYMQNTAANEVERAECTEFILSECKRLQNMAYQLLDLAALREIKAESSPVAELFEKSRKIMQVKAHEAGVTLTVLYKEEMVYGDMELLIVLLNNLIDNAIKASKAGENVRISASEVGGWLFLEVADQGNGMTKEQIRHIKEAFYRVDKSRSRAAGGAGLGLAICDRIVQLHHGELEFISAEGEGCVARVKLPL